MAQTSYPDPAYNSGALTESEWERVAVRFSDDGVYGDPSDLPLVVAGVGLNVTVKAERHASVRGHNWYSGTTDYSHTIATNASGSTRIDRIVLQLDRSTWQVRTVRKAGTPGSGAPALQQDTGTTGLYEIPVARVTVGNNASSVTVQREELFVGTRVRPCTSSTRPPNPKRSEVIHETDTGKWMGWNGTSWVTIYQHTGAVSLGAGFDTWDHYESNVAWKHNNHVTIRLAVRRLNSELPVSHEPGSMAATVSSQFQPSHFQYFTGVTSQGAVVRVQVRTDGEIWIFARSKDMTENSTLTLTMNYQTGEA